MKLKANDTLHVSSVKQDSLLAGEEFELEDAQGQSLIDRGLATKIGDSDPKPAPAPKPEPIANKGTTPAKKKG